MIKVYVDTGGLHPQVRALERQKLLETYHYPFENKNAKVRNIVPGSGATWGQSEHVSWAADSGSWDDDEPSSIFLQLRKIVGGQQVDAQHLDSALKAGCQIFVTSDKGDIWSKRDAIQVLTGLVILHMPSQVDELITICAG
ncbi:hypothetical protein PO883_25420 [Massilia sp. DJPM01]|uniref:hypothetical protein n=1 Tax=Massilia sp. DJPM01 TaxID=3024404 RepID=UPI00259FD0B4|nr:hypothetical protein [Massilia sp. DJPM01]MDM5180528.1 hypothetical protein [Massilia sp. DJPM01]